MLMYAEAIRVGSSDTNSSREYRIKPGQKAV